MNANAAIGPAQNALDSLNRVARDLEAGPGDVMNLKGALAWGWHCVGLLAYLRLQPGRVVFDAWVQDYLHEGEPDLASERDARWEERERLSFLELLDLMSQRELPILKPEFYQGWQDRTTRCLGLRERVHTLIGAGIAADQRDELLLLLAAYHRLIRLPAGVVLDAGAIAAAFPALLDLIDTLVDPESEEAEAIAEVTGRCRSALQQA